MLCRTPALNLTFSGEQTGPRSVALERLIRHPVMLEVSMMAKAVLVAAVPPLMLKTAANPGGLPIEVFDSFRAGLAANRAQFYRDVASGPFYGFNRDGVTAQEGVRPSLYQAAHNGA